MEKSKKQYYVYLHIKESDGTPFYVGKGSGYRAFERVSSRSNHWKSVVNKYGYDVIILEEGLSEDESLVREVYWINRIGRKCKGGPLINQTDGGDSPKHSQETKDKISRNNKRFYGKDNHFFGRKHSEESIKKMSETWKEKWKNGHTKKSGYSLKQETREKISKALKSFHSKKKECLDHTKTDVENAK